MRTGGERYFGVYLGTVLDVDDPDGLGRVRLETDQYTDTQDDPTWAAVCRPLAGDVFTVFFTPKEGDQVVFSFLAGDVRQPIVLGYAHANEKKPAEGAVSTTKHAIVVNGVGSVTFDESEESISVLHKNTNTFVKVKNDGTVEVSGSGAVALAEPLDTRLSLIAADITALYALLSPAVPGFGTTTKSTLDASSPVATQSLKAR